MLDERALLTLLDEPAPPPVVTLEQVLRKGQRRVRVRRFSIAAMVFVMVATVAGGGLWLRSVSASQSDDLLANDPMVKIELPPWPETLHGWSVVTQASCSPVKIRPATGPIPSREAVEPVFLSAVAYSVSYEANPTVNMVKWGELSGFLATDIPMAGGAGSVQFAISHTETATPVQLADADVNAYGTCAAPLRKVLESGTVMQLYAPDVRSPHAPIQHVRTYLPNGLEYSVTSAGWSRQDVKTLAADTDPVVQSGRGRLPLSSQQLVDIADRMVQLE